MAEKSAYQIIKHPHITEKAMMLQRLKTAEGNPSLKRCQSPKYVFIVDRRANKQEIAQAIEKIYAAAGVKVVAVNTLNVKPKPRNVRRRAGFTHAFKKAIVTLRPGDNLDHL